MQYDPIDQAIRDEIQAGINENHSDAEVAVDFLELLGNALSDFIKILKKFFDDLKAVFENH